MTAIPIAIVITIPITIMIAIPITVVVAAPVAAPRSPIRIPIGVAPMPAPVPTPIRITPTYIDIDSRIEIPIEGVVIVVDVDVVGCAAAYIVIIVIIAIAGCRGTETLDARGEVGIVIGLGGGVNNTVGVGHGLSGLVNWLRVACVVFAIAVIVLIVVLRLAGDARVDIRTIISHLAFLIAVGRIIDIVSCYLLAGFASNECHEGNKRDYSECFHCCMMLMICFYCCFRP